MTEGFESHSAELRRLAEQRAKGLSQEGDHAAHSDPETVLHELRVHQIELEIQNEELRRLAHDLESARQRYLSLFHQAPCGYVELDQAGIITEANDTFCLMVNKDRNAVIGSAFSRFLHPTDRDVFMARYRALYQNPLDKRIECRIQVDTTDTRHVLLEGRLAETGTSKETVNSPSLYLTVSDITLRKEAEQALQTSEERFRNLVQSAPVSMALLVNGCVVYVNPAATDALGYTAEEIHGSHLQSVVLPEDRGTVVRLLNDCSDFKGPVEIRFRHRDGHTVWGEVVCVPTEHESQPAVLLVAHDITERKRLEAEEHQLQQQLLKAQNLEMVGRLAGGVAHGVNNMLSAIIGYTEIAQMKTRADDPIQSDLMEVRNAAQRLTKMTHHLLAFAQKQVRTPRVLDVNATVDLLLPGLRRASAHGVELIWRPSSTLWETWIDPSQLEHIITGLYENACDALSESGVITISTWNTTVSPAEDHRSPDLAPGDYVVLSIEDNGPGMDTETQAHLFEPFYTSKGLASGSGLGMATIYGIIKQNDGAITIDSAVGRGTRICVYLKRYGSAQQKEPPIIQPQSGHSTVLIVDEEPAVRRLVTRALSDRGYGVISAASPIQALEIAAGHQGQIDVLLSAVVLPEISGAELASRLKRRHPMLKVLFMSAYSADTLEDRYRIHGDTPVLQKPFTIAELVKYIQLVLHTPLSKQPS